MRLLLVLAAVVLGMSGCTDTTDAPSSGGDTNPDDDGSDPQTVEVSIQGFAFQSADVTIQVGDNVRWTNNGGATHTVDSTDGGPLDSGNIAGGGSFVFAFTDAGTYTYRCDLHPQMTGTIRVVAP